MLTLINSIVFSSQESERLLTQAQDAASPVGKSINDFPAVAATIAKSLNLVAGGEGEAAGKCVAELESWLHNSELWPFIILAGARFFREAEGTAAALRRVQNRARKPVKRPLSPFGRRWIVSRTADLATAIGEVDVARELIEKEKAENDEWALRLSATRLALLLEDAAGAAAAIEKAEELAQGSSRSVDHRLLSALTWFAAGDHARAFDAIDAVAPLLLGNAGGAHLVWVPITQLVDLARAARDAGHADMTEAVQALPSDQWVRKPEDLSPAELRTLHAIASHQTLRKAAEDLGVSLNTVKFHLRAIYPKLGVTNKKQALHVAAMQGLVTVEEEAEK